MLKNVICRFTMEKLGNIIINDTDGNILYMGMRLKFPEASATAWNKRRPALGRETEWEFTDVVSGKFYQVNSSCIDLDGELYQCHALNDVTMYSDLMQEISSYSRQINDEKKFQDRIMKKLTLSYDSCLSELVSFCHAAQGVLFMESEDGRSVYRSSFISFLSRVKMSVSDDMRKNLSGEGVLEDGEFSCFLSGEACSLKYALYLEKTPFFSKENYESISARNVIRLFIENSILREKHIYASEHDKLTGLYNKGKFLAMKREGFGKPGRIAVFNMDVNNLKTVNDTMGHEAGDNLIIKAADSINAVIDSDDILAFRTGGDEFIVVARNTGREEAEAILSSWRNMLNVMNARNDGLMLTVACGMVCGEGDYNIDELLGRADELMYYNKQDIKKKLGLPER